MGKISLHEAVGRQRKFFCEDRTKSLSVRKDVLRKLKEVLKTQEDALLNALHQDLGKSNAESYMTELSLVYREADFMLEHIDEWSRPKEADVIVGDLHGKIYAEPYGVAFVIAPWNYPVNLSLMPAIGALAAGNTVVLKPSEYNIHTARVVETIINEAFPPECFFVADAEISPVEMWNERYDYIFFTGSSSVGKIVMTEAAKNLTPVSLELGGKSPCIVEKSANLETAARRIAWGKLMNAGQTCVAPDYVLVDTAVKETFLDMLVKEIHEHYPYPLTNESYPKIVNEKHFRRLCDLIGTETGVIGGSFDASSRKIEPTLFPEADWNHPVMEEEIFGPLLPVIGYEDFDAMMRKIKSLEKPLACYVYTENINIAERVIQGISYGGGCVNDNLVQLSVPGLPFGGVGNSGMGQYHGKYSFDTFSHLKSVVFHCANSEALPRYAPYDEEKFRMFKRCL